MGRAVRRLERGAPGQLRERPRAARWRPGRRCRAAPGRRVLVVVQLLLEVQLVELVELVQLVPCGRLARLRFPAATKLERAEVGRAGRHARHARRRVREVLVLLVGRLLLLLLLLAPVELSVALAQVELARVTEHVGYQEVLVQLDAAALGPGAVDLAQGDADQALGVQGALHAPAEKAAAEQPRLLLLLMLLLFRPPAGHRGALGRGNGARISGSAALRQEPPPCAARHPQYRAPQTAPKQ